MTDKPDSLEARLVVLLGEQSAEAIEPAARILWQMGNFRIGNRAWNDVGAHYLREAEATIRAYLAADAPRLARMIAIGMAEAALAGRAYRWHEQTERVVAAMERASRGGA